MTGRIGTLGSPIRGIGAPDGSPMQEHDGPQLTWLEGNVRHVLSHTNTAKRAGRTACGHYVEFWPKDLSIHEAPTCIMCMSDVRTPDDLEVKYTVGERWEDVVRHCKDQGRHLVMCDNDGYCCACGYQDDFEEA